jgi:tetratricopeptide (TPR) repeat protein
VQDEVLVSRSESEVAQWYYRLSQDLKTQGYEEEAERIYKALLQWRPEEYRARYLLGNLLARNRRWDEALEQYRKVPPHDKHFVESRLRMSAVLRLLKQHKQAYDLLFDCAKLHPGNGQLFLSMGKLLYDMEMFPAAVRAFERSVQLLPRDPQAHYLLGFMYTVLGRENWALAAWRKAVDLAPEVYSLRYDLGYMYIRRGRYDLAAKEFAVVSDHWPDDIETSFMLGLCYKELMEPARSIPLFEKVLRRNPRHGQALYYLGACYLQIGNTSLGKAYLRRYDHLARQNQHTVVRSTPNARKRSLSAVRSTV